ncbi:hypothetical protein Y032_0008g242 [Ancylostoma ceylanicum]|uniref:Uncharacterized protein n=1 Tax=Ancylostoma ceylanicum TaxID=53326 RepID=A0A016VM98_9BILA|nr:hypothetical protein Y032_0008g242 [Ancylostoma ceylanicum]
MSVKTFTLGNLNDACGPFFVRQRFSVGSGSAHGETLSAITAAVISTGRSAGSFGNSSKTSKWKGSYHRCEKWVEPANRLADTAAVVIADKVLPWALLELTNHI